MPIKSWNDDLAIIGIPYAYCLFESNWRSTNILLIGLNNNCLMFRWVELC